MSLNLEKDFRENPNLTHLKKIKLFFDIFKSKIGIFGSKNKLDLLDLFNI